MQQHRLHQRLDLDVERVVPRFIDIPQPVLLEGLDRLHVVAVVELALPQVVCQHGVVHEVGPAEQFRLKQVRFDALPDPSATADDTEIRVMPM